MINNLKIGTIPTVSRDQVSARMDGVSDDASCRDPLHHAPDGLITQGMGCGLSDGLKMFSLNTNGF